MFFLIYKCKKMLDYNNFLSQMKQIEINENRLKTELDQIRKKKKELKLNRLKQREKELKEED